jgi:hypothetical protein
VVNTADSTWTSATYTPDQATFSSYIALETANNVYNTVSNLGDIRPGYFHVGPPRIDPLFHPLQRLPRDLFIRTDSDKRKYANRRIILPINLGARYIKSVSGASKNALYNAALLFQ